MIECCYAVTFMLTVTYGECHNLALYVECHYVECHFAECRGAVTATVLLQRPDLYK
jgi:hypothetical protein